MGVVSALREHRATFFDRPVFRWNVKLSRGGVGSGALMTRLRTCDWRKYKAGLGRLCLDSNNTPLDEDGHPLPVEKQVTKGSVGCGF